MNDTQFQPGQKVRVVRNNRAGRLEANGTIIGYYRCGAWWVRLEPYHDEVVFDAHEIHPIEEATVR